MEHIFVSNGETQLALVPQNEIDKGLLRELMDNGPVEIEWIRQPVGILGKSVSSGIIIRRKRATVSENILDKTLEYDKSEA
jgi:DNA-binding Lrp family transcriptional regulator